MKKYYIQKKLKNKKLSFTHAEIGLLANVIIG